MKPRVLLVDDDEKNLTLLTVKLDREGYDIETASNGMEALDKADSFRPDIILMDVMMPRMDGYEALRRLKSREETRYIPVIMITGRTEVEDKILGFEVGAEDYISKPYSLKEVAARVKSLLRMRALQTKLRESEKMAALGEVVDGIAHEVRNPLTTIGGMARRLHDHETDPQHRAYAERIMISVVRLERMMQRIDDYKAVLTSTLKPGSLNAVVTSAVEEARGIIGESGKHIAIETHLMPDAPSVDIDAVNMRTAIVNILQNSIDAIEKDGRITVKTFPALDQSIILKIADTGCGMSLEEQRNIFSPFHTSKIQGAGLGLTISFRVVQDHGGEITVESEPGAGTTVLVSLFPSRKAAPSVEPQAF